VRTLILSDTSKDGDKLRQIRYITSSFSSSITLPGFQIVTLQHACLPRLSQYDGALTGLTIHCVSFFANAMGLTLIQTLHATKLLPILYIRNSFKTSIALMNMKLGSKITFQVVSALLKVFFCCRDLYKSALPCRIGYLRP
jgi:hypothetical protein